MRDLFVFNKKGAEVSRRTHVRPKSKVSKVHSRAEGTVKVATNITHRQRRAEPSTTFNTAYVGAGYTTFSIRTWRTPFRKRSCCFHPLRVLLPSVTDFACKNHCDMLYKIPLEREQTHRKCERNIKPIEAGREES